MSALELSFARIEGKLDVLATKADVAAIAGNLAALTERVHAQGERLSTVESTLKGTVDMALGKTLGFAGGVTLFGGMHDCNHDRCRPGTSVFQNILIPSLFATQPLSA